MKEKKKLSVFICIFLLIELLFYSGFLLNDFQVLSLPSSLLKILSIGFCVLFSLFFLRYCNKKRRLVPVALFCTLMADLFLLFPSLFPFKETISYCIGVVLFLFVQSEYYFIALLHDETKKRLLPFRFLCFPIAIIVACLTNLLYGLCFYYISFFLFNLIDGFFFFHHKKQMVIGLLLFFICDVCVGFFNLLPNNHVLSSVFGIAMWLFYLPGQVLITLSMMEKGSL